jgi:hypothetical protein
MLEGPAMSDIFISYASADRERAGAVSRALQARGWSVWWDRAIPPGRQYDDVIEDALDGAKCVVVLWSKTSTASTWVRNEASEAMRRKVLIPATIDTPLKIPLEFRRLQAADLAQWDGQAASPEFDQFCDAIANALAGAEPPPAHTYSPPAQPAGGPPAAPAPAAPNPPPSAAPGPMPPAPARPPASSPSGPPPAGGDRAAPPVVSPVPAAAPTRSKKPLIIIGSIFGVLLVIAAITSQRPSPVRPGISKTFPDADDADDKPGNNGASAQRVSGIHMNLNWTDYALAYSGKVDWDGDSSGAVIGADVYDGQTRRPLVSRKYSAAVSRPGPGRVMFSTSVDVPGDSRTAGPHAHSVNLIFQAMPDGGWSFVQNCMGPNNCY